MKGYRWTIVAPLLITLLCGCKKQEMSKSNSPVSFRDLNFAGHSFEMADVDHHLGDVKLYYLMVSRFAEMSERTLSGWRYFAVLSGRFDASANAA